MRREKADKIRKSEKRNPRKGRIFLRRQTKHTYIYSIFITQSPCDFHPLYLTFCHTVGVLASWHYLVFECKKCAKPTPARSPRARHTARASWKGTEHVSASNCRRVSGFSQALIPKDRPFGTRESVKKRRSCAPSLLSRLSTSATSRRLDDELTRVFRVYLRQGRRGEERETL